MRWFVAVLLCATAWCEAGPVRYRVRDMGLFGGGNSLLASGINNHGEINAVATTAEGWFRVLLFQGRRPKDIGLLPGFDHAWSGGAINDRTEIVGVQYLENFLEGRAFLYTGGKLIDLDSLMAVAGWTQPIDINNRGHIVGYWFQSRASRSFEGFLFANGVFTLLPKLAPDSPIYPTSLNDNGDIVGSTPTSGPFRDVRAILIRNGQVRNLGVLPGIANSVASSINNRGTIVGTCHNDSSEHARGFVYRNGPMTDVGLLPGFESTFLSDVNNHEQIVGGCLRILGSGPLAPWDARAVVVSNGVIRDLNDLIPRGLHWKLTAAVAINDHGEIIAQGESRTTDEQRTFLLTPIGRGF
jgi:probable HAF family extracellular repeat protein